MPPRSEGPVDPAFDRRAPKADDTASVRGAPKRVESASDCPGAGVAGRQERPCAAVSIVKRICVYPLHAAWPLPAAVHWALVRIVRVLRHA